MFTERTIVIESSLYDTASSTMPVTKLNLNDSTASTQHICEDYFGEQPLSFRTLLKRKLTSFYIDLSTVAVTVKRFAVTLPIFPANWFPFGTTSNHMIDLFSYLRMSYMGFKGSIRYTARTNAPTLFSNELGHLKVSLAQPSTYTAATSSWTAIASSRPSLARLEGTVSYIPTTNGGVEFELPFYSNNLFAFSAPTELDDTASAASSMELEWFRNFMLEFEYGTSTLVDAYMTFDVCSGEDFTFLRYQGPAYYSADPLV